MKVLVAVVFLLLLGMPAADLGHCAEPLEMQPGFSFGLPFDCGEDQRNSVFCLADEYMPGRPVVLIHKNQVCKARTGATSTREIITGGYFFEATFLLGTEKCPTDLDLAIVGVDPEAVRVISPKEERPPRPRKRESLARELLKSTSAAHREWPVSDASPRVVRVGKTALFMFKDPALDRGPIALSFKSKIFPLEGNCTWQPLFFTVHDKLYLAYMASFCCDCGERILYVYDLSGETPRQVYKNGSLST